MSTPDQKEESTRMARKSFRFPLSVAFAALYIVMLLVARSISATDDPRSIPVIGPEIVDAMKVLPGGLTALPEVPVPADNPQSPAKVELGKRLFFDTRLSGDSSSSCSTCHSPDKGFTDGLPRSKGFKGVLLRRNSPTVLNAAFNTAQFWDGRAATLDEQCKGPLLSPDEMNMVDEAHLISRLNAVPEYRRDFQTVFNAGPSLDNVARAIAAFERTLITPNARFDQYMLGNKKALTDQEKRGLVVFFGRGACSECHKGANFTDNLYHNLGTTVVKGNPVDLGRFEITKNEEDRGAFKTPSIRNATITAPYMHDGSSATLEDVVEFYDRGGGDGPNKDKLIYKLNLSAQEKSDLVAFLNTLTGTLPQVEVPQMYADARVGKHGGKRK
jgi:cytochrome c peroxidase